MFVKNKHFFWSTPPPRRVSQCPLHLQSTLPFVSPTFSRTGSSTHGHSNRQVGFINPGIFLVFHLIKVSVSTWFCILSENYVLQHQSFWWLTFFNCRQLLQYLLLLNVFKGFSKAILKSIPGIFINLNVKIDSLSAWESKLWPLNDDVCTFGIMWI